MEEEFISRSIYLDQIPLMPGENRERKKNIFSSTKIRVYIIPLECKYKISEHRL